MKILIITGMEGAENCAAALSRLLTTECDVAQGRRSAITMLNRGEYAAVILDEALIDSDPQGADLIWERTGLAIPMQINFALTGVQRLAREIRMALSRAERERAIARAAAAAAIENELKTTVAGLLLHSQLALADLQVSSPAAEKLRLVADLAGSLREQLTPAMQSHPQTALHA
ncbi:hypothetical protein ACFPT7_17230 [Acidicapsa dinghuensis]|uniref:ANTAR domain-containing protein n=1 Tax=Acidicapsa dinghuensis TaxID=2218256 RepID=A0ABW1EIC7_9BACT|nr:hypothetical protein [Acidicapsa dinghuensis]